MKRIAVAVGLLVSAIALTGGVPVSAAPTWAPAPTSTVHPGVQTFTQGSQCTSSFVFHDASNVYLSQTAHCASTASATETDGCKTPSLPLGTPVTVLGASRPGVLVYSSWIAMQQAGETDPNACAFNDFALVRIDPVDVARVNPSIPLWGGPAGLNTTGTVRGSRVYSFGNSILRLGITLLSPKIGMSLGDEGNGWMHVVQMITPGISGDSGSAVLDASGNALGVVSTIGVGLPGGVVNTVSNLDRALAYMRGHSLGHTNVALATGTVPFNGNQLPLLVARPVDDPIGGLRNFLGL